MKTDRQVGFRDTYEMVAKIDKKAESEGLNRTNFLRKIVRDAIKYME